jgi:hypothetical protein
LLQCAISFKGSRRVETLLSEDEVVNDALSADREFWVAAELLSGRRLGNRDGWVKV